ncbi:hypothetical protein HY950_00705 [Candidatus Gottesmanbacteria bacterium]|nr:hypothetical protein [Candidatus Gottesmanbacteria bacterium]
MKRLSWDQRKSLSEFSNTVAAAWFTAGVISPLFTKAKSLEEVAVFLFSGLFMTGVMLRLSLLFLERK